MVLHCLYSNDNAQSQIDPFILNTFNIFRKSKKEVIIDLDNNRNKKAFVSLFFDSVDWEWGKISAPNQS